MVAMEGGAVCYGICCKKFLSEIQWVSKVDRTPFCIKARISQLTGRTEELLCDPLAAVEVSDAVLGVGPPPVVIVGTLKVLGGDGGGEQGQEDRAEGRLHLCVKLDQSDQFQVLSHSQGDSALYTRL